MFLDQAAYRSPEKLPIGALYRNTNSGGVGAVALILIIDDDGFYRGLIERALGDEGTRSSGRMVPSKGSPHIRNAARTWSLPICACPASAAPK